MLLFPSYQFPRLSLYRSLSAREDSISQYLPCNKKPSLQHRFKTAARWIHYSAKMKTMKCGCKKLKKPCVLWDDLTPRKTRRNARKRSSSYARTSREFSTQKGGKPVIFDGKILFCQLFWGRNLIFILA